MFQRFPFVRFTFFFALGIVSRHYLGEVVLLPQLLLFAFILGYLLLLFKNSLEYQRVLAILGFVLLFSLGAYRLDFYLVDDEGDFESTKAYKAQLISEPEEKKNSARAVLEVYELLNDSGWVKSESRVISGHLESIFK